MIEPNEFELRKFVAPEIVFGIDARKLAGQYARNFGARKILVVTDPGVAAAGWTDDVVATLKDAHVDYTIFSGVTSNPKAEEVMEGVEVYRRENCNAIVAVGGGSPIDCAKGIGIVITNKKNILDFQGVDNVQYPSPPLICVPTTAGSSADVSQFAIITDHAKKRKTAIVSKIIVADVALIDPVTTTTMSPELTAETGFDAMCHAIEAFVSTAHSPLTDLHAIQAISLIINNLPHVIKQPKNFVLRGRMMLASLEAGLAFSNASLGAIHALSHSLGGLSDAAHGLCNAVLLPYVVEFNFDAVPERYRKIGQAMGLEMRGMSPSEACSVIVSTFNLFVDAIGLSCTLREMGVTSENIKELSEKAMVDLCIFTNPRRLTKRDIEAIYEQALRGPEKLERTTSKNHRTRRAVGS